ncbi:unnamed protein product [Calicophoron daubneyi]|uniref:Uncharacterized protein n=1 Tax=Calicophoron daubneyi TaxID=300641 RepID=A0AAV2TBC6_CALDB
MSKSIHARLLIVGRRGNEDNTEECHKALNYREQSSADFLRRLAQCTCGTFAVLRTSQRRRDCDAGCIVWPVLKNRPSKEREFYTHMMMDTESVDTVASISGRIYPKWTKDYQPVLMSRTLACCPHPCKTEIQDKPAQETCVGDGCIGCLECTPHYHSPCRWTRTCINKRLVKDLNCRLRMCAEREADTNQWWLAWSAQDLRTYKLLEGRRVLARRKQNGQFYLGRIFKVESGDTADRAIICFGAFRSTSHAPHCHKDVGECSDAYIFESIPVTDLIDLAHALRHPIRPGDKVLVPCLWASGRCAQHSSQHCKTIKQVMYQAGTVISGRENRSQSRSNTFDSDSTLDDSSELVIELAPSNRQVGCHCVPSNRAIWIPPGVFERITLEQHMPANSRQWLRDKAFIPYTYPVGSAPGYPRDGDYKWLQTCKCYHNPHTVKGPVDYCQFHCGPELQVDYGLKSKCWPLIPVTEALMANPKGGYSSWNSKKETGIFPPGAKICPDHCCHCWKKQFCPVHNRSKRQRRRKRRHLVECDTLLDADCHIHEELDTPHSA